MNRPPDMRVFLARIRYRLLTLDCSLKQASRVARIDIWSEGSAGLAFERQLRTRLIVLTRQLGRDVDGSYRLVGKAALPTLGLVEQGL